MTVIAVRERFVLETGRHSLVTNFSTGDFTDKGANRFLNDGQRFLDRKASYLKENSKYIKDLTVGDYKLEVPYCDVIKEVWLAGSEGSKRLDLKTDTWIRENFGRPYASILNGTPQYWAPMTMGLSRSQRALTSSDYTDEFTQDFEEIKFGDHWAYNGVLFMAPTDTAYTMTVVGRFKSQDFTTDTDKTYWTEVHPDLLVLAAMYSMERFYRNTQGQQDLMLSLLEAIKDIDKDSVEQESTDADQMEG